LLRYHENRFDEAEQLFNEARTLAKSAGDRFSEYQANEYQVMISIERGDYAAAGKRCVVLGEIGSRLRSGSEAPFARALAAVCDYAQGAETPALEAALEELRSVDAKHRLAYALTRAAMIDLRQDRPEQARARAKEALTNAEVLERATDMLLAHLVLLRAARTVDDEVEVRRHRIALRQFEVGSVAEWARLQAEEVLA
jgi:tetratricopeptide (TPR) repeat protein